MDEAVSRDSIPPRNLGLEDTDLIRLPDVTKKTTLSPATIYERMKLGTFPLPVRLGSQSVAWRVGAIRRWSEAQEEAAELGPKVRPST